MTTIPVLDWRDFSRDATRFVREFGTAYEEYGFCGIRGHGVSDELLENAYAAFRAFFALPADVKMSYHIVGGAGVRGYTGFGVETAKDAQHPDLKEFWHIGPDTAQDPGFARYAAEIPDNIWPAEVANFRVYGEAVFRALDALGSGVLGALALHLGLEREYFRRITCYGTSILRPIHYPPIANPDTLSMRSAPHEDINLITLLVGSSAAGLQVLTRDGKWVDASPARDTVMINVGDMLQRFTNHRLRSTTHRVVNPSAAAAGQPRFSVPFFLHPNADWLIETLPSCISAQAPNRYPEPILAQDYLMQRLREIRMV